jgi:hypothetical protein
MSPTCEAFIRSVIQTKFQDGFLYLNGLNMYEMLRGMAALDRADLTDFWSAASACSAMVDLPRIQYARDVVVNRTLPSVAPGDLTATGQVDTARQFLANSTPIVFENDLTGALPSPLPSPPKLSESDFERAAAAIGSEVSAIKAVARVESGGRSGYSGDGRPVIRYELHVFDKLTGGVYRTTHPYLSISEHNWRTGNRYHDGTQHTEWSLMYNAMILRDGNGRRRTSEAWQSASWGMFQVMGSNFSSVGWTTIDSFVSDMFQSEGNQLRAFSGYIRSRHLAPALRNHNWTLFASVYNGADFAANNYDWQMGAAYATISEARRRAGLRP